MFEKAFPSISALSVLDIFLFMSKSFVLCDSFFFFFCREIVEYAPTLSSLAGFEAEHF